MWLPFHPCCLLGKQHSPWGRRLSAPTGPATPEPQHLHSNEGDHVNGRISHLICGLHKSATSEHFTDEDALHTNVFLNAVGERSVLWVPNSSCLVHQHIDFKGISIQVTTGGNSWNRVPLKPSSLARLMINFSIQNFIPSLVPLRIPSGLRSIKEKGGLTLNRTLQGPPGYKSPAVFPVSCL